MKFFLLITLLTIITACHSKQETISKIENYRPPENPCFPSQLSEIVLSPDGEKIAFKGVYIDYSEQVFLFDKDQVTDDELFFDEVGFITWSQDSRHMAYIGRKESRYSVILDGNEVHHISISPESPCGLIKISDLLFHAIKEPSNVNQPHWSGDSKRFQTINQKEKSSIIVDGQSYGPYDKIAPVIFGTDKHWAIWVREKRKIFIIKDGKRFVQSFEEIPYMIFDPQGSLIFIGTQGELISLWKDEKNILEMYGIGTFGGIGKWLSTLSHLQTWQFLGGEIRSFFAKDHYYFQIDQQTIFDFNDLTGGGPRIELAETFQEKEASYHFFLISVYEGDGCPLSHVFIDLKEESLPTQENGITEYSVTPLENCTQASSITLDNKNQIFSISFPKHSPGSGYTTIPATTWVYQKGVLKAFN